MHSHSQCLYYIEKTINLAAAADSSKGRLDVRTIRVAKAVVTYVK